MTTPEHPPGQLNEESFSAYLNGVANHEPKLFTAALVLQTPDEWFTGHILKQRTTAMQGSEPAWRMHEGTLFGYCHDSLEPIGAVVEGTVTGQRAGRQVRAVRAAENPEPALALTSVLLDWSLRNPNIALQYIFGGNNSRSETRAPYLRHQIYGLLLDADRTLGIHDITESPSFADSKVHSAVRKNIFDIEHRGIFEVDSKIRRYDPDITILSADFAGTMRHHPSTSATCQAVYGAMRTIGEGTTVSLCEFLDKVYETNPEADMKVARAFVLHARNGANLPGLRVEGHDVRGTVRFSPGYEAPIGELRTNLEAARDPANHDHYHSLLRDLMNDPEAVSTLFAKARTFSYSSKTKETPTSEFVLDIIRQLGRATTREMSHFATDQGRSLTPAAIQQVLKVHVERGLVAVQKRVPSKGYVYTHIVPEGFTAPEED